MRVSTALAMVGEWVRRNPATGICNVPVTAKALIGAMRRDIDEGIVSACRRRVTETLNYQCALGEFVDEPALRGNE
jgi:hypothetical protein